MDTPVSGVVGIPHDISLLQLLLLVKRSQLDHRHLIRGKRTSFIRAYNGSAAQGFHGGKLPYDGVFLSHAARAQSKTGSYDGR